MSGFTTWRSTNTKGNPWLADKSKPVAEPRVAVIIPCYNSARFVGEAIESALAQTYPAVDVIVINDGSTDDLFDKLVAYRDRIVLINQANRGLAAARNRGLDASNTEFVAFLDADDRWHPDKIARQVAFLQTNPESPLVYTERRWIDEHGQPISPREYFVLVRGRCVAELARHNTIAPSTVLIRRTALGEARFDPSTTPCEDWDLWLRLSQSSEIGLIEADLTDYRIHESNMSRNQERMVSATVQVMNNLLDRTPSLSVRRIAKRHRRECLLLLGHLKYERGCLAEARHYYCRGLGAAGPVELLRLMATCLPAPIYRTSQALWRAARGRVN